MTNPQRHRYRFTFAKEGPMRFTGHLDLHHSWERTLRRAGIQVEHTQGYNPRMRINLGLALPLGFTSECELIDILLEEPGNPKELLKAVQRAAPPGLIVQTAQAVEANEPTLQKQITSVTYEAKLPEAPPKDLPSRIQTLLDSPELPRERRGKAYDLRPLVESLEASETNGTGTTLVMRLAALPGATGRPEEVLLSLGLDPLPARIRRVQIHLSAM